MQSQTRQRHALFGRDADRRKGRIDLIGEVVAELLHGAERIGVAVQQPHPGVGQQRQHARAQTVGLRTHDLLDAPANLGKAVRRSRAPQRRHPHHEELVQVGADDSQEAQALQQRDGGRLGPVQHPAVERQPTQRTVEIPRRRWSVGRSRACAACGYGCGAHGSDSSASDSCASAAAPRTTASSPSVAATTSTPSASAGSA